MLSQKIKYLAFACIACLWICVLFMAKNNKLNIYELPYHFLFGGAMFYSLKFIKDIFTKKLSSKSIAILGVAVILGFQYYFFSILQFAYFEFIIIGTTLFALLFYIPFRLIKS